MFSGKVQLVLVALGLILFVGLSLLDVSKLSKDTLGVTTTRELQNNDHIATGTTEVCVSGNEGSSILAVCNEGSICFLYLIKDSGSKGEAKLQGLYQKSSSRHLVGP